MGTPETIPADVDVRTEVLQFPSKATVRATIIVGGRYVQATADGFDIDDAETRARKRALGLIEQPETGDGEDVPHVP